ncbi:MAG: EamA family transporter [Oscillospiraceae bacterium]|nr:EamA family transporter [Oscillospiraceae bacterium]
MELWIIYAVGAAVFAALTTTLAKIGLKNVNSHLATAIRAMVVLIFAWLIVFITGVQNDIWHIEGRTWVFLILSGISTGGAWLCLLRALKLGNVNRVVPIDKSSTILTMTLAFIFLGESIGPFTIAGMILMGLGTWLMIDFKKDVKADEPSSGPAKHSWLIFAVLAAVFASLTAIFGRAGVPNMDANLWTAIRTAVVVPVSWLMVFLTGGQKKVKTVDRKSWIFLILSGMATGGSWLFFYHALQIGNASFVVPIDKLSIVLTMGFARMFLGERFTVRTLIGLALLTIGTLLPVILR